ncbi:hypothetical protein KAR91_84945 [Candidatus Pacearchaeota archaeon]|nr:hypothetical protein [Candidatus Pacearchaeota archaeon]
MRESITPEAEVTWTDLKKPDKHGYFTITLAFEPKKNEEHAKFLKGIKGLCAEELTAEGAKPPYWQKKGLPDTYCLRFSTQYEIKEWRDRDDKEIAQPRMVARGTHIRIKYKAGVSGNGKYLNLYLNGVQIISIPSQAGESDAASAQRDIEDPDDVPF